MKKWVLICLIIGFQCASICNALTRTKLVDEIRRLAKDTNTDVTKQSWSTGTIVDRINMAQIIIVSKTRCMENQTFLTIVNNQREYNLPSDLLVINRVGYTTATSSASVLTSTSAYKKIDRNTILGLDGKRSYWEQETGFPDKYYILGSSICLTPIPTISYTGTFRIKVTYTPQPNDLDYDTSVPFNDYPYLYPYHHIITYYVAMLAFMDRGDTNMVAYYRDLFKTSLDDMIKDLNTLPDWNPNFSVR